MTSQSDLNPQVTQKKAITIRFQRIAIIGYVGLLLLMPVWLFLIDPREEHSNGFIFSVYILPIILPRKVIIKDKP